MTWPLLIRFLHVFAAASWFGMVVAVNFVLIPSLLLNPESERGRFLATVFPKVFRTASYLSGTVVACGAVLLYNRFHTNWPALWDSTGGRFFLVAATLGTALTTFHFVMEPRLEGMVCRAGSEPVPEVGPRAVRILRVVPRIGLAVISTVMLLMMAGSHGW